MDLLESDEAVEALLETASLKAWKGERGKREGEEKAYRQREGASRKADDGELAAGLERQPATVYKGDNPAAGG